MEHRTKQLVEALIEELDCNKSYLLHGGPRAPRRAVSLLVQLGRAAEVTVTIGWGHLTHNS